MPISRDCTITDLSDTGARLFFDEGEVPDRFYLIVAGESTSRHECRVIWRLGGELGVEFASPQPDQSRLNSVKRLREDARKIFHDTGRSG